MIYVLNIGYESFAFANSRGLQTVMDAMSKAQRLKEHYWPGCEREHPEKLELSERPVEVSMHVVNGVSFVSGKKKRDVIEPEVMARQSDESDAVFAMRCSRKPSSVSAALALRSVSRRQVAAEMTRLIGEGN